MPPAEPEVVLAVVTSWRGVLLIERRDRKPLLAFPGGEVDPHETLAQAAARQVLEETAIVVLCHEVLAVRTHPDPGARVAYLACTADPSIEPMPALREALTAQ